MTQFKAGRSGNPNGRAPKYVTNDGWMNALGGKARPDKRNNFQFEFTQVAYEDCRALWRGDPMAALIIELFPFEMLREAWGITTVEDKANADALIAYLSTHQITAKLFEAETICRGLGGAALVIGYEDNRLPSEPLNVAAIRGIKAITVVEAGELVPYQTYSNPLESDKYRNPEIYQVLAEGGIAGALIHESRIIKFQGVKVGTKPTMGTSGSTAWGDSILNRLITPLRDFNAVFGAASAIVSDFSQAVYKVRNLAELVTKSGGQTFRDRMAAIDLARSTLNAVVLDAELEDFERKATPLNGFSDLQEKAMVLLSAAAGYPVTRLFRQSPAGLQATGASDIRNFYDDVVGQRERRITPALTTLVTNLAKMFGLKPGWTITYPPLWQPTDLEQAQARYVQWQTDSGYIADGVLGVTEVTKSRFGGARYSFETTLDLESRKNYELAQPTLNLNPTPAESKPNEPKTP